MYTWYILSLIAFIMAIIQACIITIVIINTNAINNDQLDRLVDPYEKNSNNK